MKTPDKKKLQKWARRIYLLARGDQRKCGTLFSELDELVEYLNSLAEENEIE